MKAKVSGLLVLAMHIVVLAGFSFMQGCKTAKVGDVQQDTPVVLPAGDISSGGILPAGGSTPAVPSVPSAKIYSVKKGDTLSSIASAHGTTWKKLAEYNNLSNPNELKVGQELRISESSGSASAPVKHAVPASSRPVAGSIKQGSTYVIQKGDMLSTIAKRSGLTTAELKTANSMTSDNLVSGKSLTIPKKGAIKAPAAAKAAPAKAASAKTATPAPAKAAAVTAAMPAPAPLADAAPAAASTGTAAPAVAPAAPAVPAAASVASAGSAPVYEHVLYPGETLDDVARQYGSSQQEIMKLNSITDAASVKPGTKLLVPIPE